MLIPGFRQKTNDQDTNASVSEVEIFNRNNKEYYRKSTFIKFIKFIDEALQRNITINISCFVVNY